jgi:hypothetical protein
MPLNFTSLQIDFATLDLDAAHSLNSSFCPSQSPATASNVSNHCPDVADNRPDVGGNAQAVMALVALIGALLAIVCRRRAPKNL